MRALLLVTALCTPAALEGENLLRNGDFESGLEGWALLHPPANAVTIEPGPSGNCACLSATDRSGSTYITQALDPERIRGRTVRLEASMRAENVVLGTYPYSQAKATLVWTDGLGDHNPETRFLYTFGWRRMSATWAIGPECTQATLYLGMHTTTGTVWFDDVALTVWDTGTGEPSPDVVRGTPGTATALEVDGREFVPVQVNAPEEATPFAATADEKARGFVPFRTPDPSAIFPGTVPLRGEVVRSFRLLAAPGQYEPIAFAVHALRHLRRLTVTPGPLAGPGGATIPATAFDPRMGRYVIQRIGYTSSDYYIVPKLLVRAAEVPVAPERPQLFWLTLHVPEDARPGEYRGVVRIRADGAELSIPVAVSVPAVRLSRGKPWMLFFYDSNPKDAERYFRDMREHGMTSVILAQVQAPLRREGDRALVDFATSDPFVDAYREAGFTDPLVYNPFHDRLATLLLEQFGLAERFPSIENYGETIRVFGEDEYPPVLHEIYRQVVRDIRNHAREANWPPMLFYPVDEPNELGDWRIPAARLEYRLTREAVPGLRTFCTAYSVPAMERLDPWLDVRTVPISSLIADERTNTEFRDYLRRAGGEIWGIEWPAMWDDFWRAREIAGFLPAKAGVTGMTSWTYYTPAPVADEYDDLRGEFKHCLFVYRDTDGSLVPTVTWEGIRAGATDWRYFATLEEEAARATGSERDRAMRALHEVRDAVPWSVDGREGWGDDRATQLRAKLAEAIARLQRRAAREG